MMTPRSDVPVAWPRLGVVAAWAFVVFCGRVPPSRANGTVVTTLAMGSLAVASAMYLIADLRQPYSGMSRVSPAPRARRLADIDK
jgi:hypothetical protein